MRKTTAKTNCDERQTEQQVKALLTRMTMDEKIGQMCQLDASGPDAPTYLGEKLRAGRVGSVLNITDVNAVNELQRIAVEESRLGIPLLVARDVIHGFATIMPIPLGQAAAWNPEIVEECARFAAIEAARSGINWTLAPMMDISRDPRWGRIAESSGEDAYLASILAAAAVKGYQGFCMSEVGAIGACAKHFAGYGAVEAGRDYAATNIPENELHNVYLRPFKAAIDAGVMGLMTSFSDLDGVPATASEALLGKTLRDDWGFDGVVVSDWDSIRQLKIHGITANDQESAHAASTAGVDLEMAGDAYANHLAALIKQGKVCGTVVDKAVANILRAKLRLGLFERPYTKVDELPPIGSPECLDIAKRCALQSIVMLKNSEQSLPLNIETLNSLAVIGPLADEPYEQLGTWVFDGDPDLSITPLEAIRSMVDDSTEITYVRALKNSRSRADREFDHAVRVAKSADVVLLFLGEESILSGEAHSRADIRLPGAQEELVRRIAEVSKNVIAVVMAGRPLTLTNVVDEVNALLYAWHPGAMGGPALAELLFGIESPSGKLPVTFPRMVGQIPIYYNHKNTGKPPTAATVVHIDEIAERAPQTSFGMTSFHMDAGYKPLFAFGFGLSYGEFHYRNIRVSVPRIYMGQHLTISAEVTNSGVHGAEEVAQLYIRDLVGSVTRPVKELKGFRRLRLGPGETATIAFKVHTDDLAFFGRGMQWATEPGEFHAWIGGSSETELRTAFSVIDTEAQD